MAGHDQLWKQVLQAFFPDFVRLFDATTAAGLDLSSVEFRDSEAFTDIPHGERRIADLVAQVRTVAGDPELVLVHVEIQRVRQADFSQRMWQYYALLRQREGLPVIPIALVLYPAREGVGVEEYVEAVLGRTYLTFRFVQVSLPVLPAQEYVTAQTPLGAGLASVMRPPTEDRAARVALHLACLRRIRAAQEAGVLDEARTFLLVNMIATYLPLSEEERTALRQTLAEQGDPTMEATELTWADQVRLQGRQEGRQEGLREGVRELVRSRFGSVPPSLEAALLALAGEEALKAFLHRAATVRELDELL